MGYATIIAAIIGAIGTGIGVGVQHSAAKSAQRESRAAQAVLDRQAERRRNINEGHFQAQQVTDKNLAKQMQMGELERQKRLREQAIGQQKAAQTTMNLDALSQSAGDRARTVANVNQLRGAF